jgi:hypothetical protein
MFPQTYGTRYYGKRFPIKTEKQITAESKGSVFIKYTKVIMLYLIAITRGATTFLPKQIGKKIIGQAKGITTIVKKAVSFSFSIVCKVGTKITKHVTMSAPIKAICRGIATIKKQMQKALSAIAIGLTSIQKHRVFEFEFIGSFAPGDVVKINSKTMEVTLNDENALHLIKKADFPIIPKGEQRLVYSDREGSRTVKVTVKWRDKWL